MQSFFFKAKDFIRGHCVTGVQTCALPISGARAPTRPSGQRRGPRPASTGRPGWCYACYLPRPMSDAAELLRSEERRVGKECRSRLSAYAETVTQVRSAHVCEETDTHERLS